jgi:Uma2 family endonuclease
LTYITAKTFTLADFLSQYRDNPRYELADGELIDMEPTGPHETVSGKLATQIGIYLVAEQLPWLIPRTCLIYPFVDTATVCRPDIVKRRIKRYRLYKSYVYSNFGSEKP